jgi:hypothetical protein
VEGKKMKQFLAVLFCGLILSQSYSGSSTAVVTVVGGIIKGSSVVVVQKYKRKDCPVCKGKGWYMSGDGIKRVDCGYCEPDKQNPPSTCSGDKCKTQVIRK